MFPTPVGMNRMGIASTIAASSVPHTRGDEPFGIEACAQVGRVPHTRGDEPSALLRRNEHQIVFPTPVGMNRWKS